MLIEINQDINFINNKRNYGIDFLRILSMYMIVMIHILRQGGVIESTSSEPLKNNIAWFLQIASFSAVNVFGLISGYVGIGSKYKYRNLFRLLFQTIFYSISLFLVFYFFRPELISKKDFIKAFFPICKRAYWYISAYTIMFFLIPHMNFVLLNQKKEIQKKLIWIFFILFSLSSRFPIINGISSHITRTGFSTVWLSYLYMLGGFIRLYGVVEIFEVNPKNNFFICLNKINIIIWQKQFRRFMVYSLCVIIMFILHILRNKLIMVIGFKLLFHYQQQELIYTNPIFLLEAIALLVLFSHMSLNRFHSLIKNISPLCFGVYLIHSHRQVYELLITDSFKKLAQLPVLLLPFSILIVTLIIYLICTLLDFLRLKFFKFIHIA